MPTVLAKRLEFLVWAAGQRRQFRAVETSGV